MNRLRYLVATCAMLLPLSLHAQEENGAEQQASDPYSELLDAFMPAPGLAAAGTATNLEIREAFEQDPDIADLETECPGTVDTMMTAAGPIFQEYDRIETELRRQAALRILRADLSRAHAQSAADFYASELGQKLVMSALSNYSLKGTLDSVMKSEEIDVSIDAEALAADNQKTALRAAQSLNAEELAEINAQLAGQEWFKALLAARPKIFQAGLEISNSDFAPHLDQRLDHEVEEAMLAHLDDCYEPSN